MVQRQEKIKLSRRTGLLMITELLEGMYAELPEKKAKKVK